MKASLVRVAVVLLLAAFTMAYSDRARDGAGALPTRALAPPVSAPPSSPAGYYAFIDPETGEFTDAGDPASVPLSDDLLNHIDTSDDGLVEEDSPVSGTMVRLNGRFSGLAVAVTDASGAVQTRCLDGLAVDVREVRR